jgi:hypothetical protein
MFLLVVFLLHSNRKPHWPALASFALGKAQTSGLGHSSGDLASRNLGFTLGHIERGEALAHALAVAVVGDEELGEGICAATVTRHGRRNRL